MTAPRYKWQPTTADIAAAAGIPVAEVVRFDHNTSPFPTEWAAAAVAGAAVSLNEYPGADYRPIREGAATHTGLPPDHIAVGAGVDELLLLVGRAFLRPGMRSAAITPTYPLYKIATLQVGADITEVATSGPDFRFPVDGMVDAARTADVTWICVPNNPTGARIEDDVIRRLLAATDGLVVLDAAYAEFAGDDWAGWVERHHNLLVLHTLSKGFGVAGIRVGYGLGHPDLIDAIDGVRPPGSISSPSVDVAVAALGDPGRMRRQVAGVAAERDRLATLLADIGLRVMPSMTNFLLCEVGPAARKIGEELMGIGLVVRMYPEDGPLAEYLRFTVRASQDNTRLLAALEARV